MTVTNVQEVIKEVLQYLDDNNDNGILTDFRLIFKDSLMKHSCLTLEQISFVKLWNLHGKRFINDDTLSVLKDHLIKEMLFISLE